MIVVHDGQRDHISGLGPGVSYAVRAVATGSERVQASGGPVCSPDENLKKVVDGTDR